MKKSYDELAFHVYRNQARSFQIDSSLCLFFGLNGETQIQSRDCYRTLLTGGMLAVSPFETYGLNCLSDASVVLMRIPASVRQAAGETAPRIYELYIQDSSVPHPDYGKLRELYAAALLEYLQNTPQSDAPSESPEIQATRLLLKRHSRNTVTQEQEARERLGRILLYVEKHWNEDLTLGKLAAQMYLSAGYLSRFLQKNLGVNFTQFYRRLRMEHALRLLGERNLSVTQISYECGFRSPSVFIDTFRQQYGETPGQYQKRLTESRKAADGRDCDLSPLLDYAPKPEARLPAIRTSEYDVDCAHTKERGPWIRMLNVGYARDGLSAPIRERILRAQREIGFHYIRFHGIFDEDMHIYSEDAHGNPCFCWAYADLLFDFIMGIGLTPYVELGFLPPLLSARRTRIFDRPSVIAGCRDLKKWNRLVTATIRHFQERYGVQVVRRWRFTTVSLSYVRIGCLSMEEFQELYEASYRAVKSVDSGLLFGGAGYFPDIIRNQEIGVPAFLRFAENRGCLPDFHSIQWYPCVQTDDEFFMEFTLSQQSAPAVLSPDPSFLPKCLDELEHLYALYHADKREIFLEECAATLWQRDLSADTCYKSVWLAQNMAYSRHRAAFGYWLLTDLLEERARIDSLFHGGYGLFTYNGIPKAGYHALRLLSLLKGADVAEGDGWLMTEADGKYRLLVWNYCHYNRVSCFRYKRLERPEDAYSVFEEGAKQKLRFYLRGLRQGNYRITRHSISRQNGSAFDKWLEMSAPASLLPDEAAYLEGVSLPAQHSEVLQADGKLLIDVELEPLALELVELDPLS